MRHSILFQITLQFLAFALLFVSCTTDAVMNYPQNVQSQSFDESGYSSFRSNNTSFDLYSAIELVRTTKNMYNFVSTDDLIEYFSDESQELTNLIEAIKVQTKRYETVGYDTYVQEQFNANNISSEMKDWMLGFKNDLNNFILTEPTEIECERYFGNSSNFMYSQNYSSDDLTTINKTLSNILDVVKYQYLHYDSSDSSLRGDKEYDCNFWENLACTVLFLTVIVAVIIATYYLLVLAWIAILLLGEGVTLATPLLGGTAKAAAVLTELLIGIINFHDHYNTYKNNFYKWCCGEKEIIVCEPPIGAFYKEVNCNEFEYFVYGSAVYGTTIWGQTKILILLLR